MIANIASSVRLILIPPSYISAGCWPILTVTTFSSENVCQRDALREKCPGMELSTRENSIPGHFSRNESRWQTFRLENVVTVRIGQHPAET